MFTYYYIMVVSSNNVNPSLILIAITMSTCQSYITEEFEGHLYNVDVPIVSNFYLACVFSMEVLQFFPDFRPLVNFENL